METIGITVGLCGLATLFVWYCIACCRGFANSDYRRYYYARKGYRFFLEKGWSYERFVEKYTDHRDRFGWFLSIDSKERKCYERDQFNKMLVEAPELVAKFFSKEHQRFRFRKEFHQMRDEWMKIELSFNECKNAPQPPQDTPNNNKTQRLTFEDMLFPSDSDKTAVIESIRTLLTSDEMKGKECAHLITALRDNKYISISNNAKLIQAMKDYFQYDFGTYTGINNYLNGNNSKQMNPERIKTIKELITT